MITQLRLVDPHRVELPFQDRESAGRVLSSHLANRADTVVVALPPGGALVARAVARTLQLPIDFVLVEKIYPAGKSIPLGAVSEGEVTVWNDRIGHGLRGNSSRYYDAVDAARNRLARRRQQYFPDVISLKDRSVIVIDDGLETGISMRAAIETVRGRGAAEVIVAVPVASRNAVAAIREYCDELVCLTTPEPFHDIGQAYLDYCQITDEFIGALPDRS